MTLLTVDPIVLPPDIEAMTISFLTPLLSPIPVATRLPSPDDDADTVNGFLRIENGGGEKPNMFQYDVQCILHGYSPNEPQANAIANQAIALMSAARGQTISDSVTNWYVVGVMGAVTPLRLSDPDVILPRYRAAVTWRVAGQVWTP